MTKEKYETITHTVTEEVLISEKRYCDVCGKEITDAHYWIRTGNCEGDWDEISESTELLDACSVECLRKLFEKYITRSNTKCNSEFFEIEHRSDSHVEGEITYD